MLSSCLFTPDQSPPTCTTWENPSVLHDPTPSPKNQQITYIGTMMSGPDRSSAAWGLRSQPLARQAYSGRSLSRRFVASRTFLMHRLRTCPLRSDIPSEVSLYAHLALAQRRTRPLLPRLWTELCTKRSAIAACASCWRCRESADAGFAPRFRGWAGRSSGCLLAANFRLKPVYGSRSR